MTAGPDRIKQIMFLKRLIMVLALILGVVCLLLVLTRSHSKAMKRAAQYNAYVTLRKSLQHYIQFGLVTNSSPAVADVFPCTNSYSIQGANYHCVLGITWSAFSGSGTMMAITREGMAIWLDGTKSPQRMEFSSWP